MMRKLVLVFVIGLAFSLMSCSNYRWLSPQGVPSEMTVQLTNDYLILRVDNMDSQKDIYIDWSSAHLRDPRGFEVPVYTKPANPLSMIYAGGCIEYHVFPGHYYTEPDAFLWRRSSLRNHLVYDQLHAYTNPYEQHLYVKICRGDNCVASDSPAINPSGPWETVHISGTVIASR